MRRTFMTTVLAATLGLLAYAWNAPAQGFRPAEPQRVRGYEALHRAAQAVERNARDLHEEVDTHFRPSPAYDHLHKHARDIERLAKAVHDITDEARNARLLREAVAKLDDEVHHFVDVVEEAKHFREVPPRAYAHLREEAGELHRAVRAMMRELD